MARAIGAADPKLRGGLRFWGEWFGSPLDNVHMLVACHAEGGRLVLRFDDEEMLTVWAPQGLSMQGRSLRIAEASRVRWEWFFYGRPKTRENLHFIDYARKDEAIEKSTNWPGENGCDADAPAVALVG